MDDFLFIFLELNRFKHELLTIYFLYV